MSSPITTPATWKIGGWPRFPFVLLVDASGVVAQRSERLVETVRANLERERADRARMQSQFHAQVRRQSGPLKGIEAFRSDPRYGGDGTRVDLAYAVYALAHGVDCEAVKPLCTPAI